MKRLASLAAAGGCFLAQCLGAGLGPAGAATECRTSHVHWAITEGNVSIRIAWIDVDLEACTDGTHLRSTSASTDSGMTNPGIGAGFVFSFGDPHRTAFSDSGFGGGSASYVAKGTNKNCVNHWVHLICSPTEDFRVTAKLTMANGLYVRPPGRNWWTINGRYFLFVFTAKCANSACHLHFTH
jgi:hypothetical protein